MIAHNPLDRPTAAEACDHPFFWNRDKRLGFLVDFSDRLERESAGSIVLAAVEAHAQSVVGVAWDERLDRGLIDDVSKWRRYDVSSVRDCLRILRNKRHHWHELPNRVQQLLLPFPSGLDLYFEQRSV